MGQLLVYPIYGNPHILWLINHSCTDEHFTTKALIVSSTLQAAGDTAATSDTRGWLLNLPSKLVCVWFLLGFIGVIGFHDLHGYTTQETSRFVDRTPWIFWGVIPSQRSPPQRLQRSGRRPTTKVPCGSASSPPGSRAAGRSASRSGRAPLPSTKRDFFMAKRWGKVWEKCGCWSQTVKWAKIQLWFSGYSLIIIFS